MRKLAVLMASIIFTMSAHAASPTQESIDSLLSLMKMERTMDSMFSNMEKVMRQSLNESFKGQTLTPGQQQFLEAAPGKFINVMREELSWSQLRPLYVQIYQESFTQEEIDGLIAFYKSPAGSAFVEKMPIVMQKSMTAMQPRIAPMAQKMRAAMNEAIQEAKEIK